MAIGSLLQLAPFSAVPSPPPTGFFEMYVLGTTIYLQDSLGNIYAFGSTTAIDQLTGDVSAIGPGSAVATVNFVGGESAANVASATVAYLAATSSNTPNTLVLRDSSGNFSAGVITATLNGNASTATFATTAGSATSFTGSLMGDVTGTQTATVVSYVDAYTAAQIGTSVAMTQAATSSNTASTLVLRDASGNFSANIITANLNGNATTATNATTAVNFTGSLSGDVTGTQTTTAIASTTVTGKLLTGYVTGTNTPISAANSILTAFENLQAQISATTGSAITSLTGDVTATGPGSAVATVAAIQGTTVSGTTGTGNVVFSASPTLTGTLTGNNAMFSGTVTASNISGTNTGDVTTTNTNSINLAFTSGQTGLNATLNLSASSPDAGYIPVFSQIKTDGLLSEVLAGTPVQIGTSNNIGSAASASRSDHVHAITSSVVLGLLLTGYVTGTNTPISAANSILTAFENLQAQISATTGSAITSLTGDVTATGPGAAAATISANAVTNSKLAQMPANTLKGNNTGVTGNTLDLTVSQVNTMLGNVTIIGTFDGNGSSANGLSISGNTLYAQSATTSNPGMVDNTTQSFSGNKTFTGQTSVSNTSTTAFTVNSTSLVVDATNNAVGIGAAPAATAVIDVVNNSGSTKAVQLTGYGSNVGVRGRYANGTLSSPTAATTGNILEFISGRGYGATGFAAASTGAINIAAGATFTDSSMPTYISVSTTPTGSTTASEAVRVNSTGNVLIGTTTDNATDKVQVNGGIDSNYLKLNGSVSGTFTQDAAATTTTYTVLWPSAQGSTGTYLSNDGSGNLSWSNPLTNIDGGTANSVYTSSQFINGGSP